MARTASDHPELIPADEELRLEAVRRYAVLDTPPGGALDRIATLAARILHTPIASVTIVDEDRIWFLARHGLDATETDRMPGLCASAILKDAPTVVSDAAVDPSTISNPLVAGTGLRFYAAAPLITSDGYRLGTLNVIDHKPRDISADEVATLQDLAAMVVDELELRLAARRIGETRAQLERLGAALQVSVLPPPLPDIAGLDLAALYRPAGDALEIGGDFYDVFEIRPRTWLVAIGDVCGRGAEAAVLVGSVRNRLRALAAAGMRPAQVLAELNRSLVREGLGGKFLTLCCLEVRPAPGRAEVTMSAGGHPLPLVRRANGRVETVGQAGPLLGVFPGVACGQYAIELGPDDLLLLYTDGLIERRGVDPRLGERALRWALSRSVRASAVETLCTIEEALPQPLEGGDDDTAVLILRVRPRGSSGS
ncbi:MAG TPA: GAF domain-containing SpoIIE family protein phosphatase [Actinomycetota bacterium]|nr:GAF domain-containing SpoIIE family protein phosphatase [Actinomycetota bacterium]